MLSVIDGASAPFVGAALMLVRIAMLLVATREWPTPPGATQPGAIPRGFPAAPDRSRGIRFKVADCDLKDRTWRAPQVSADGVH
jgi:hypothetical protein